MSRSVKNSPQGASVDYRIGPEDVLDVSFFDVADLNRTVRVANDGTINLPLVGTVEASGFTATELQKVLGARYGRTYLQHPQISIYVKEFHAQPVSVIGSVERPGLYPLTAPRTLIEMLSMAGGLAGGRQGASAGNRVYVTRRGGFGDLRLAEGMKRLGPDKLEVNLDKLLYSHDDALNIQIRPMDIISISKADIVYVTGRGVQKPGGFLLEDRDQVTVFQALAMAEGLSSNAAKRGARIIRQQPDGSYVQIPVDLDKILKGTSPDPVLVAKDVLYVPDSTQKAALKRSAEAVMGTLSGLLIYGRL